MQNEPSRELRSGVNWTVLGGVVLALLILMLGGLAAFGYLEGDHLTPVLAFVGTFLTAALTFIGLVVKDQGDRRLELERHREDQRLEVEAAMKAAALLSCPDGKPAHPATVAGALLALSSLDQTRLAVNLLHQLWPTDGVSGPIAALVLERALTSPDPALQNEGAVALLANVQHAMCATDDGRALYSWPSSFDCAWRHSPPSLEARHMLLEAWLRLWIQTWNHLGFEPREYRREQFVRGLYVIYRTEPDDDLRHTVALILLEALTRWPRPPVAVTIDGVHVNVDEELRDRDLKPLGTGVALGDDIAALIDTWEPAPPG